LLHKGWSESPRPLRFLQHPLISSHLHKMLHRTICALSAADRLLSRGNAMTFVRRFVTALAALSMSGAMLSLALV